MRDNLPSETEGVASAQSWTQHLFQEPGHIAASTGPGCKYLWFSSYTICLWVWFLVWFGFHTDSTIYYAHSRPHLESINVFPSF